MRATIYAETAMTMTLDAREFAEQFFLGQDKLKGDFPAQLIDPAYRAEIAGFPAMDAEGHAAFGRAFYAGFPDLTHTIDEAVATDEGVAVRFTARGTHTGTFMGIPATGRTICVPAMVLLTISDGRARHLRAMFDRMGLMQQLGVIPG